MLEPGADTHAFLDLETAFLTAFEERGDTINRRSAVLLPPDLDRVHAQVQQIRKTCQRVANPAVLVTIRKHGAMASQSTYRTSPDNLASFLSEVTPGMRHDHEIILSIVHSVINPSKQSTKRLVPVAQEPDILYQLQLQVMSQHPTITEVIMNRPFLLIAHSDKQHPSLFEAGSEADAKATAETILAQQSHVSNVDVLQLIGSCRRAVNVHWDNSPKEIPA